MADLTTKERKRLPKGDFGEPGKRAYPMPDKAHARNAKARASEMEHNGKLSASEKAKIDAKADKLLGQRHGRNDAKMDRDERKHQRARVRDT